MGGEHIRIRVSCGQKLIDKHVLQSPNFWYLIDTTSIRCVNDLKWSILNRLQIPKKEELTLELDGFLLPPEEKIFILQNGDAISVTLNDEATIEFLPIALDHDANRTSGTYIVEETSRPKRKKTDGSSGNKSKKRKLSEDEDNDQDVSSVSTKKKRKKSHCSSNQDKKVKSKNKKKMSVSLDSEKKVKKGKSSSKKIKKKKLVEKEAKKKESSSVSASSSDEEQSKTYEMLKSVVKSPAKVKTSSDSDSSSSGPETVEKSVEIKSSINSTLKDKSNETKTSTSSSDNDSEPETQHVVKPTTSTAAPNSDVKRKRRRKRQNKKLKFAGFDDCNPAVLSDISILGNSINTVQTPVPTPDLNQIKQSVRFAANDSIAVHAQRFNNNKKKQVRGSSTPYNHHHRAGHIHFDSDDDDETVNETLDVEKESENKTETEPQNVNKTLEAQIEKEQDAQLDTSVVQQQTLYYSIADGNLSNINDSALTNNDSNVNNSALNGDVSTLDDTVNNMSNFAFGKTRNKKKKQKGRKRKGGSSLKEQQLADDQSNNSTLYKNPPRNGFEDIVDVEDLKSRENLEGPPRKGDKIAYMILEMGDDYCPKQSDFKGAVVLNYFPDTKNLELEPVYSHTTRKLGKFDLVKDGAPVIPEPSKFVINFNSMIEPKLINDIDLDALIIKAETINNEHQNSVNGSVDGDHSDPENGESIDSVINGTAENKSMSVSKNGLH